MTAPRLVLADSYVFVTRRTSERRFFLKPSKVTNQAFEYCMARAAKLTGVRILWATVMSNHYHLGLFDPNGALPRFMRELNRLVACHNNRLFKRSENLFSDEPYNAVRVATLDDLMDKFAYSVANPCAADLVEHARTWPGVRSLPASVGMTKIVRRPKLFFRERGTCPDSVELKYELPPLADSLGIHGYRAELSRRIAHLEQAHRTRRERARTRVLGRQHVLRESAFDRPLSAPKHKDRKPVASSKDPELKRALIKVVRTFRAAHRVAMKAWKAGKRDVLFPAGTYEMRRLHGCKVEPAFADSS